MRLISKRQNKALYSPTTEAPNWLPLPKIEGIRAQCQFEWKLDRNLSVVYPSSETKSHAVFIECSTQIIRLIKEALQSSISLLPYHHLEAQRTRWLWRGRLHYLKIEGLLEALEIHSQVIRRCGDVEHWRQVLGIYCQASSHSLRVVWEVDTPQTATPSLEKRRPSSSYILTEQKDAPYYLAICGRIAQT